MNILSSTQVYWEIKFLTARALEAYGALERTEALPALGTESCFALIFDGVPIGGVGAFSRHGNPIVTGLIYVSSRTGQLTFLRLPPAYPASHAGPDIKEAVLTAIAQPPFGLTRAVLRSLCTAVGGDGAVVLGGPSRKSASTAAAELIWNELFPLPELPTAKAKRDAPATASTSSHRRSASIADDTRLINAAKPAAAAAASSRPTHSMRPSHPASSSISPASLDVEVKKVAGRHPAWLSDGASLYAPTSWDHYHRESIKTSRATKSNADAQEISSLLRLCDERFHLGDGQKILRLTASAAGTQLPQGSNWVNVTRQSSGLAREVEHFKKHFKTYAAAFHTREEWRQLGHDTSQEELVQGGRRLTSVQSVAFGILFGDFLKRCQEPWTLRCQVISEPWSLEWSHLRYARKCSDFLRMLFWCRQWIRVIVLLRPFCALVDLRKFIYVSATARPSLFFIVSRIQDNSVRKTVSCRAANANSWPPALAATHFTETASSPLIPSWTSFFPVFIRFCSNIIAAPSPTFDNVELHTVVNPAMEKLWCLAPHCQCSFLAARAQSPHPPPSRGRRKPVHPSQVVPCSKGGPLKFYKGKRTFYVPAWVINTHKSAIQPHAPNTSLHFPAPLRFHHRDPLTPLPLGVPPSKFHFRDGVRRVGSGHLFSCHVPAFIPNAFKSVDAAIESVELFVTKTLAEDAKLYGDEGVNHGMLEALAAMKTCFNFERLTHHPPTLEERGAFRRLVACLLPQLRKTQWPPEREFPTLIRGWPTSRTDLQRGLDALEQQYVVLLARIRATRFLKPLRWESWWETKSFILRPVLTNRWWQLCFSYSLGKASVVSDLPCDPMLVTIVTSLVLHFLFPAQSYQLSPPYVAKMGTPWRKWKRPDKAFGKGGTQAAKQWMYDGKQHTAILLWRGVEGKLVHVSGRVETFNWSAVSSALDMDRFFIDGVDSTERNDSASRCAPRRRLCWHAVQVHHHCRPMAAQEVPCEQTGSQMHKVWELLGKNQFIHPQDFMDAVLIREGHVHCIGGERDTQLCRFVTDALLAAHRSPTLAKRTQRWRKQHGVAVDKARVLETWKDRQQPCDEQYSDLASNSAPTQGPTLDAATDSDVDLKLVRSKTPLQGVAEQGAGLEVRQRMRAKGMSHAALPDGVLEAKVQPTCIKALPLFREDKRTNKKDRADSTLAASRHNWLVSPAGLAWFNEAKGRWRVRDLTAESE